MIETLATGDEKFLVDPKLDPQHDADQDPDAESESNAELVAIEANILKERTVEDLAPIEAQLQALHTSKQEIEEHTRNYIGLLLEVVGDALDLSNDLQQARLYQDEIKEMGSGLRLVIKLAKYMRGELPKSPKDIFYGILSTYDRCDDEYDETKTHLQSLIDAMITTLEKTKVLDADFIQLILEMRNCQTLEEVNALLLNQEALLGKKLHKNIQEYVATALKFQDKVNSYAPDQSQAEQVNRGSILNELDKERMELASAVHSYSFPEPVVDILYDLVVRIRSQGIKGKTLITSQ